MFQQRWIGCCDRRSDRSSTTGGDTDRGPRQLPGIAFPRLLPRSPLTLSPPAWPGAARSRRARYSVQSSVLRRRRFAETRQCARPPWLPATRRSSAPFAADRRRGTDATCLFMTDRPIGLVRRPSRWCWAARRGGDRRRRCGRQRALHLIC